MSTDKIDFLSVGGELSLRQKEIAISIWKKIGCFETISDDAHTVKKFREENVIARTFYNYSYIQDYTKLVILLKQIIDFYKYQFTDGEVNSIGRLYYSRRGKAHNESYVLICKPSKGERVKGWNFRINLAATVTDHADKMQTADPTTISDDTFNALINKVCNKRPLEERPALLKRFIDKAQEQLISTSTTLALIEASKDLENNITNGTDNPKETK